MFLLQNFASTFYNCDKKKERLAQLKVMEMTMERAGYNRSSLEIESRLNNLRQQFKVTSKEREAGMAIKWKFYEAMDKIMNSMPMDKAESLMTNK
jgi:Myb/SANT-like DNA-binding domain